jgi:microcin C transport system permease protein
MLINFAIVQSAPGGPVDQAIAHLEGLDSEGAGNFGGASSEIARTNASEYRGSQGLTAEIIAEIEKQYGFDKPAHERFWMMIKSYLTFDFGDSFKHGKPVTELIVERMPVSISLGLWSTLIVYLISIPLGIYKATHQGSRFDVVSSTIIIIGYAIPSFMLAIFLIILFAGGQYWDWFPLRGLTSSDFEQLSTWGKIKDYADHLILPTIALTAGSFATLTMLTKNSFLDEIGKQYVITARSKGVHEKKILTGHVFRNAMLIIISGLPGVIIGIFFTGTFLIEVIFSLEGLGLLGYEAVLNRDYPIIFGTLFIFTLISMVVKLISDLTYTLIDPRIDFEANK